MYARYLDEQLEVYSKTAFYQVCSRRPHFAFSRGHFSDCTSRCRSTASPSCAWLLAVLLNIALGLMHACTTYHQAQTSVSTQEPDGSAPAESKMRNLPPAELLAQLPPLQKLLERLMDCLPRGLAARHFVVQASLLTVAKESFQVGGV